MALLGSYGDDIRYCVRVVHHMHPAHTPCNMAAHSFVVHSLVLCSRTYETPTDARTHECSLRTFCVCCMCAGFNTLIVLFCFVALSMLTEQVFYISFSQALRKGLSTTARFRSGCGQQSPARARISAGQPLV